MKLSEHGARGFRTCRTIMVYGQANQKTPRAQSSRMVMLTSSWACRQAADGSTKCLLQDLLGFRFCCNNIGRKIIRGVLRGRSQRLVCLSEKGESQDLHIGCWMNHNEHERKVELALKDCGAATPHLTALLYRLLQPSNTAVLDFVNRTVYRFRVRGAREAGFP